MAKKLLRGKTESQRAHEKERGGLLGAGYLKRDGELAGVFLAEKGKGVLKVLNQGDLKAGKHQKKDSTPRRDEHGGTGRR